MIDNNRHSNYDLAQMQALPLQAKIAMTNQRIKQWYDHYDGEVYISFSGGKDSTVLLHLVRNLYPDVEAVFVDTGLEYPEIRSFVKTIDNVTWLKPKMNFKQTILKYGYPVISKEVANTVRLAKPGNTRWKKLNGEIVDEATGKKSVFNCPKWKFMLDAPFQVSEQCCDIMKKRPSETYEKESGKHPYLGLMACESKKRKKDWVHTGCNAFEKKRPQSQPMAFWTENDVLTYLLTYNIPYATVYGDIVETGEIIDTGLYQTPELKTTGCKRTGCMFCMFGCHLEKEPNRFQLMKKSHPKQWEYCMKPIEEGGLGMAEVLKYIGVDYE